MTKIDFSGNSTVDTYVFTTLILFEPKYEAFWAVKAKIANLVKLMDDVYEAYGSLEGLELLTDIIERSLFIAKRTHIKA